MAEELILSVELETAPGVWLELEDAAGGYEIGGGSFADRQEAVRLRSVGEEMMHISGSIALAVKQDNVVETLEVWVTGDTHYEFDTRMTALKSGLRQVSYRIRRTIGDSRQTWKCQPANITTATQQAYIFSTTGLLTAQVPRLPSVTLAQVTP